MQTYYSKALDTKNATNKIYTTDLNPAKTEMFSILRAKNEQMNITACISTA